MLLTVNVRFGLVIVLHGASVFQDVCRLMELAQSKTLPALGQRKKKAWRNHEKGLLLKRFAQKENPLLHMDVYSSFIHNHQNLETTKMSFSRRKDK